MIATVLLSCARAPVSSRQAQADLVKLLHAYHSTPPGPGREELSNELDAVAGQRYAAWSGLYWHRDLESAKAEARATGRPILSLRMLGRLDEDLSCANSRFFRIALYANAAVSRYLREHYVLHWSSERPVPVARIDFGDGRVLERTVAGNSAHYVLDSRGRPVDVLPGLYMPALFEELLRRAEPVAASAGSLDDAAQAQAVASFHRTQKDLSVARFGSYGTLRLRGTGNSLADAEALARSKNIVEQPLVRAFHLGGDLSLAQARSWERGSDLWMQVAPRLAQAPGDDLDENSRALFAFIGPVSPGGAPLPAAATAKRIQLFEQQLHADAAFNELSLHQQLHDWLATAEPVSFEALNERVYRELFLTPAADQWLGMQSKEMFTAVWQDGIKSTAQSR
jgi:hypothetical protein